MSDSFAVSKVVVIPWVGRIASEARWPEHDFILIVHTICVIVFVDVVTETVVVVVPWSNECVDTCVLRLVGPAIAVPIIVCPVENAVVVMIPSGLFFTPETLELLVDVRCTIVVVVPVFTIGDTVIVIVDIIELWEQKPLALNSLIPNGLEEPISIGIRICTIIVIVLTIESCEEVARRQCIGIVIPIAIRIDFEIIPDTVVIIVNIVQIEQAIQIIV